MDAIYRTDIHGAYSVIGTSFRVRSSLPGDKGKQQAMAPQNDDSATQLLLDDGSSWKPSDEICTKDGTVDQLGRPASRLETGRWRTSPFILGTECCERLAFYGINTNLVVYLTKVYHIGNASAARDVATWAGTGYLTPLIGAFVADSYLGRYRTIWSFATLYLVGLCILTLSAGLSPLTPAPCPPSAAECSRPTAGQLFVLYLALYMIALGMGGIKSCVSAFGADQFDDTDRSERKKKGHFFNWFYLSINLGAFIAATVLVYVQDNVSWSVGYGIPVIAMLVAVFCFISGSRYYRHQKPSGSPLTRIAQVLVATCRKWRVPVPQDESSLYGYHDEESVVNGIKKIEHTKEYRFLDKAATTAGKSFNPAPSAWYCCTVSQVEEVKKVVSVMPIWASTIFFSTCFSQMSGTFVVQGTRMENRVLSSFKIPAASMSAFELLVVLILVPLYDRVIVKVVRRYSGHQHGFTQLQRMGIGLLLSVFAMASAVIVERKRLQTAKQFHMVDDAVSPVPMSIFWQVPQFALIGVAETFTYIGQLEFFYEEAPDSMRSLGTAMAITTYGVGYYINSIMIALVAKLTGSPGWIPNNLNRGHIDYYFGLIAVIGLLNFFWFLNCARKYNIRN